MLNEIFLSMDLAELAGFAINQNDTIVAFEVKEKNPILQLHKLIEICISNNFEFNQVIAEDFVYFNGFAKAQASLLKRLGYFQLSLEWCNCPFTLLNLSSVRAKFSIPDNIINTYPIELTKKGKRKPLPKKLLIRDRFRQFNSKITDNHSDAIAMIMQYDVANLEKYKYEVL